VNIKNEFLKQIIENSSEVHHFSRYGKNFQEKIFQGLISDKQWSSQMVEVMRPNFFDVDYLQFLTEKYFAYYEKYRCFPTLGLLVQVIKEELSDGSDDVLRDQIIEFLLRVKANPNPGDIGYVKDKTLDFCKRQAFKGALEKSVDLIQGENFEQVIDLMKNAVSIGMQNSSGHDFFEDIEARFVKINRNAVPTGFDRLDKKDIFKGGLGRGEIGVVTANTGVGKSHWLVALGANAMRAGKNVLHYTFELTETAVGLRYDSNLCGIPSNDVQDNKELVKETYQDKGLGRLIIKEYPTGSASVVTLRNHIEKLALKGFKPNVIIIDYADIMKSTRSYDSLRHELKLIYEELRNLAMELDIPVWTASQANRDSAQSDIVGLENMSEAYGKAMVADVVISLSRKAAEKSTGVGRLFIAKNRAGRDGIVFPITIDTSMSMFSILDENAMSLNEATEASNSEAKAALRKKWREVKAMGEEVEAA
jgi:replicative DNA helicase